MNDLSKEVREKKWREAAGMAFADGGKASDFMNELVKKNINGEITHEQIEEMLVAHYKKASTVK